MQRRPDRILDVMNVGNERIQRWASRFLLGVAIYRGQEIEENLGLGEKIRNLVLDVSLRWLLDKQLELASRYIGDSVRVKRSCLEINLIFTHITGTGSIIFIFQVIEVKPG